MKNFTSGLKKIILTFCLQLLIVVAFTQVPVVSGGVGQTNSDPNNAANGGTATGLGCGGGGANYYGGNGGDGMYGGGGGGAAGLNAINMIGGAGGQGVLVVAFYNGVTFLNSTVYNSGTSLVIGPVVTSVKVWAIGAGGGGAGSTNNDGTVGGGGGAGGTAFITMTVLPGDIITYSLGAGGTGGIDANNGSAGSNTTAIVDGITITGNGGSGGQYNNNIDAAGGSYSGGDGGSNGGNGKGSNGDNGGGGGGGIGGIIGGTPPGGNGANGANAGDISGLFAALSGGSILPINWTSFTATNQNRSVSLQWQTIFEQNTLHFTVQHSTDGINFKNINVVAAAGNSNSVKMYSYLHQDPPAGTSYYRLVQTYINGRTSLSDVVKNNVNALQQKDIIVITNPVVNGILKIQLTKNDVVSLLSFDGKLVYTKSLQKGLNSINVAGLPKGNYIVQAGNEAQKIVIQ